MAKQDSSAVRVAKWGSISVLGAALIGLIGVLAQRSCENGQNDNRPKKYISGVVLTDDWKNEPVKGVNVVLNSLEGKFISQDKTDQDGKYSVEVPRDSSEVRIMIRHDGFFPYERRVPVSSGNSIALKRLPHKFGIPENAALESALAVIEKKLGIAVPFSSTCQQRAKKARVHGVDLEAYRTKPEEVIRELTNLVKDTRTKYDVGILEVGRRYEIKCY